VGPSATTECSAIALHPTIANRQGSTINLITKPFGFTSNRRSADVDLGKRVIVTGASSGIGARALAAAGA